MAIVRRTALSILLAASAAAAACNAINGSHDRFLDDEDGGLPTRPDAGKDDGGVDGATDAPVDQNVPDDGAPLVIAVDVGGAWTSPNGATFATVDGGKKITAYDGGATHPVIMPLPQPMIPAEDYTVHAIVRAPAALGEFGILTRVQPMDKSAIVLSSSYGQQPNAFVGNMSSSDWNPSLGQQVGYTFVASARYRFQIKVTGKEVRAKFWVATDPEPAESQFLWPSSYATGRGVGFYTYGVVDAVLESMTITVP